MYELLVAASRYLPWRPEWCVSGPRGEREAGRCDVGPLLCLLFVSSLLLEQSVCLCWLAVMSVCVCDRGLRLITRNSAYTLFFRVPRTHAPRSTVRSRVLKCTRTCAVAPYTYSRRRPASVSRLRFSGTTELQYCTVNKGTTDLLKKSSHSHVL